MSLYYRLTKDKQIEPCDLYRWAKTYEPSQTAEDRDSERRVGFDEIGESQISTVFLGIDHRWGEGPPILFETKIFGGPHDEYQERCCTYAEALEMHQRAIDLIKKPESEGLQIPSNSPASTKEANLKVDSD